MKILCDVQVINRQFPNVKTRSIKSTLAIGYHPPNKDDSELFLIHFTPQNTTGVRYKVKGNLEKVHTKFICDGKVTISLKQPQTNLLINCNPIQLKSFLQILKLGLEGKRDISNLGLGTLATTAIPQKLHPVKNLVIVKPSDFPVKGIPKTVEHLVINNILCTKIDSQILFLNNLKILNLSNNNITKIPKELGKLSLVQFDISKNCLGCKSDTSITDWKWLEQIEIRESLKVLNLSENKLTYFPYNLVKLNNLYSLKMNTNELKKIPFAIRRMVNLRFLYLSNNLLESLPNSINHLYLDTLDVWENKFLSRPDNIEVNNQLVKCHIPTLWELAARTIVAKRIPYSPKTIPWILVDLITETPICACGRLCYSSKIYKRACIVQLEKVKHLIFSRDRLIYQDCVVCSERCAAKLFNAM